MAYDDVATSDAIQLLMDLLSLYYKSLRMSVEVRKAHPISNSLVVIPLEL